MPAPSALSPGRRLTAVAVGLVLALAATIGAGAAPASAVSLPGAPTMIGLVVHTDGVHVYWAPPSDDGGSAIVSYNLEASYSSGGPTLILNLTPLTTAAYLETLLPPGSSVSYRVRARNADGFGPFSDSTTVTSVTTTKTDYTKFGGSIGSFINRQYQDFFGRPAKDTELLAGQGSLTSGPNPVPAYLTSLINGPARASRQAVVRLYLAYFKRSPDHGGLAYWTAQLAAKKKNLDDVSNSFARSTEFKRTYGSLSNADFVTLVYKNVLGRTPEATGFAFWKGQLDQKLVIRGRVMTQFSESSEYKTASRAIVQVSDAWDAMIGTPVPVDVLSVMSDHILGGGTIGDVAQFFIDSAAYKVS